MLSVVGVNSSAHDIEVENDDGVTIYYNYINKKTELEVTYRGDDVNSYYKEYTGEVVIPSSVTIDGKTYSVTSIGNFAFQDCTGLIKVFLPSSITSIGYDAFISKPIDQLSPNRCLPNLTDIYYSSSILPTLKTARKYYIIALSIYSGDKIWYDSYLFGIVQPNNVTLHVPSSAIDAYSSSTIWNSCKSIVAMEHTLKYVVDGETYESDTLLYGAKITPVNPPIKEGYNFSGWEGLPLTMPDEDVTIEGLYVANNYTLTYKVDDHIYKTESISYGASIMPEPEPEKEGCTFSGWSEIPETMPAHDVEVVGLFKINKYKLTYKVDGKEYKSYDVRYGSTIFPIEEPTKEGYTFSGWSEIPEIMPAYDVEITGTFSCKKGDVNGDGAITMADANMVVNYFLATDKPDGFDTTAADVNEDGYVTMADANQIVNMFLGSGKE